MDSRRCDRRLIGNETRWHLWAIQMHWSDNDAEKEGSGTRSFRRMLLICLDFLGSFRSANRPNNKVRWHLTKLACKIIKANVGGTAKHAGIQKLFFQTIFWSMFLKINLFIGNQSKYSSVSTISSIAVWKSLKMSISACPKPCWLVNSTALRPSIFMSTRLVSARTSCITAYASSVSCGTSALTATCIVLPMFFKFACSQFSTSDSSPSSKLMDLIGRS